MLWSYLDLARDESNGRASSMRARRAAAYRRGRAIQARHLGVLPLECLDLRRVLLRECPLLRHMVAGGGLLLRDILLLQLLELRIVLALQRLHFLAVTGLDLDPVRAGVGGCGLAGMRLLQRLELRGVPLLDILQLRSVLARRFLLLLESELIEVTRLLRMATHQRLLAQGVIAFQ